MKKKKENEENLIKCTAKKIIIARLKLSCLAFLCWPRPIIIIIGLHAAVWPHQ